MMRPQAFVPSQAYPVRIWEGDGSPDSQKTDVLAEETPVALVYNGISHVVMLTTPQDLEDFALGFSLTEGIVYDKSELYGVEVVEHPQGLELHCEIASERFANLKERRRNLLGRTGCGLCGAESIGQAMRVPEPRLIVPALQTLPHAAIQHAFKSIQSAQVLQQTTGATHACAWADVQGNVLLVREDVGRHNALDKLIGALASRPQATGFVLTTSRASYEMVQKVVSVGIRVLVAISAPTGLAVWFSEKNDVTLVGFVRDHRHVIYTHSERIIE